MIRLRTIILLALITLSISGLAQSNNSLNQEVTLKMTHCTKAAVLDTLETICNIFFSYNPVLIEAETPINVNFEREKLSNIIIKLIDIQKVAWKSFDNQVVFFALQEVDTEITPDTLPKYLEISGTVFEARHNNPIPYCNIALRGTTVGTMSNSDGHFVLKILADHQNDTIRFSCMGFQSIKRSVQQLISTNPLQIELEKVSIELKGVDIILVNPTQILDEFNRNIDKNYERNYVLFTSYYRELVKEDDRFTEISEAIIEVLKSPYSSPYANDHVKFVKGRKSREPSQFNDIRFKLKGGPYYITRLDVVKTEESFLNPEFSSLYKYSYKGSQIINDRKTIIIDFEPIYNVRDLLYEGTIYFDLQTKALVRAEFKLTKQGLKEARNVMIEKEPKSFRASLSEVKYSVQYELNNQTWYMKSAQSSMKVKLTDKEKRQRARFHSIAEILTTQVEQGKLQHFSRSEIFKPNEFITEKIDSFDTEFWGNYNIIKPEDDIQKAIKNYESQSIIIQNKPNSSGVLQ